MTTTATYAGAALMNQTPAAKPTPFEFDALRPAPAPVKAFSGTVSWDDAVASLLAQVAVEAPLDFPVLCEKLSFRVTDGALTTNPEKGTGLALSRHACNQMAGILFVGRDDKPRDVTQNYAARGGMARGFGVRAAMLADDVRMTRRGKNKPVNVRTILTEVRLSPGSTVTVRMARAFLSAIHAGKYTDDVALIARLNAVLRGDARSAITRTNDITYGYATVGAELAGLTRTIHFSNSETGCAGLRVGAGAVLRLVDAVVQFKHSFGETSHEEIVTLADARSSRSIRHTLPKGTDAEKTVEAAKRMDALIQNALAFGDQLEANWALALKDNNRAFDGLVLAGEEGVSILVDAVEGRFGCDNDDKKALAKVITDEKRLAGVPHGSAAHIAAAFAVLAKKSTSMVEATRLQELAGQWIVKGWNR